MQPRQLSNQLIKTRACSTYHTSAPPLIENGGCSIRILLRLRVSAFGFKTLNLLNDILVQLKGVRIASSFGTRCVQGEIGIISGILPTAYVNAPDCEFSILRSDKNR